MRDAKNITELLKVDPDFIGFIFHESSPRNVREVPDVLISKNIKKVGVFVNKQDAFISDKVIDYRLDFIQLHGNETPAFCKNLYKKGYQIIKAFAISEKFDFAILKAYEPYCNLFLFDALGENAGGNGIVFNWKLIQKYNGKTPFLLSGGINKDMVSEIKRIKHPACIGIDVNSGFESEPAIKKSNEIKQFLDELRSR